MLDFSFMWDSPGDAIFLLTAFAAVLMAIFYAGRANHAVRVGEPVTTVVEDLTVSSNETGSTLVPTLRILDGPHSGVVRMCDGGMPLKTLAVGDRVTALYDAKYKTISTEHTRANAFAIAYLGVPIFLTGMVFFCYLMGPV